MKSNLSRVIFISLLAVAFAFLTVSCYKDPVLYTVALNDGNNYREQKVAEGSKYTFPDQSHLTKGRTLKGWIVNGDESKLYQPEDTIVVESNLTITAKWEDGSN